VLSIAFALVSKINRGFMLKSVDTVEYFPSFNSFSALSSLSGGRGSVISGRLRYMYYRTELRGGSTGERHLTRKLSRWSHRLNCIRVS
jgi:hypothetical protein